MSKSLNKCIFIGNLGSDPEVRSLPDGTSVATLNLAVSDDYKDRSGNKVERTEWVRVVAFSKLADIAAQYLRKGSKLFVEGKLSTRKWKDKDGQDRSTTEIKLTELIMLDGNSQGSKSMTNQTTRHLAEHSAQHRQVSAPVEPEYEFSDEIPF